MNTLSRRALLRSIGAGAGGMALLPLMSRLTSANTPKVARFLFVVEGNCYYPITVLDPATKTAINAKAKGPIDNLNFWPNLYNHTSPIIVPTTDFSQTIALPAIASLGLASHTAVVYGLSSVITGGGHTAYHGALSSSRTVGGSPGGQTIDAYLAAVAAVRGATPYDAVRVGMSNNLTEERLGYYTCATAAGVAAGVIVDPVAAYNVLFGLVGTPAQMAAFGQRNTMLDYANANVKKALAAFSGSSDERNKLETYLTSLEALSMRQQRLTAMAPQISAVVQKDKLQSPDTATNYTTDCMVRFAAQMELATTALQGQLTNVAVVTSGAGDDFSNLTYPGAPALDQSWYGQTLGAVYASTQRHPLQHALLANDTSATQTVRLMTRFQFEQVAKAAQTLANTPDPVGSGSMLDNTVIVFISDNGEQHHSTASEFPVVLIGGGNLGLNTGGRTIVYPGIGAGSAHRQVSNLWNTMGYLAGQQLDTFGSEGPLRVAPGKLSELMS